MMQDVLNALPDNRPITSLCVIEDLINCPPGYRAVDKTFDQDTDADLWKDGFFGKRITRYLCLSKTEGPKNEVIESISLIGEKETAPDDHILVMYTFDTNQKAMRKKYLCYKSVPLSKMQDAVTDIIVLSKSKKPPPGFKLGGEVNSLLICYKVDVPSSTGTNGSTTQAPVPQMPLPYPMSPLHRPEPVPMNPWSNSNSYGLTLNHDRRQMSTITTLDDVPFELHPTYRNLQNFQFTLPNIKVRTERDLDADYSYDFKLEKTTLDSLSNAIE